MTNSVDWRELDRQIAGEIAWSPSQRGAYATDASVYQVTPQAVGFPRTADDVQIIVRFCGEHSIPIIGRGAGTSLSGQAIGFGLVVDFSRYMNRVLDVDAANRLAIVEPGVVLDELNAQLAGERLLFAPDPATASRATIGGMIGNNACGTRSIVFGRTCDSIEGLDCLLADGGRLTTEWLGADAWQAACRSDRPDARIYAEVERILTESSSLLRERVPALPRIAAGYGIHLMTDPARARSLSDLIVGAEGTLALVTRATLRLQPLPAATGLVVSAFASVDEALCCLPAILESGPSAVELLDDVLIGEAIVNASTRELARHVLGEHESQPVMLVEFFGDSPAEAQRRARDYMQSMQRHSARVALRLLDTAELQRRAWEIRRLGLGLISNLPGKAKSIALIEDACIPIEQLPEYNRFVFEIGSRLGLGLSTYAHASVGVLHYKVMLDLHQQLDRQKMREMAEQCFAKCLELGGVFSGEHGDGIVRGEFLRQQFGPEVYDIFVRLKQLFDPQNQLNPGRKIDSPPLDRLLRYGDGPQEREQYLSQIATVRSRFRYPQQENLVGAIEQCNGVGACRQLLKGTMCPSYRATMDERHSTRGRANLLRLAISGQLDPPGLANPQLHEALELCLACKACKSECPNAVDLARLKSEALQVRWDQEGVSAAARFFADMPRTLARVSRSLLPKPPQWLVNHSWARKYMARRYGIDRARPLPSLARRNFDKWWSKNRDRQPTVHRTVALFVDAWHRFLEPDVAIAAVELLWACGYQVEVPAAFDGLRSTISVGLIDEARRRGDALFAELDRFVQRKLPIVCLEPSEASALRDDLPDLVSDVELGRRIAARVLLLEEWLAARLLAGDCRIVKRDADDRRPVSVHLHCHQRALFSVLATEQILQTAGYAVGTLDLGCCGMAGSFGYVHHEVSQRVARLKFLPAIETARRSDSIFVAAGTSCRQQALDLAGYTTTHWLELVRGISG